MSNSKIWQCLTCEFVYSEAGGIPEEGIPAGTAWKDVPQDWQCPDCAMGKDDFEMQEVTHASAAI